MTDKDTLIIVPAYNERHTVGEIVTGLRREGFEVLVVDDGSVDDTSLVAEQAGALVLRLPINLGVGGALRAGFRYAVREGYGAVIQVDADGQHPVNEVRDLIHAATIHEADLVIGSRYLAPHSTLTPSIGRRFAMRFLAWRLSLAANAKFTDSTSGFRMICEPLLTDFADTFPQYYLGDTFEATIRAARNGYRIVEIPASLSPRQVGESTISGWRAILMILKVVMLVTFRLTNSRPRD